MSGVFSVIGELILSLAQTLGVILGFAFLFGLCLPHIKQTPRLYQNVLLGIIFGLFGLYTLAQSFFVAPDLVFDLRNALIIVASVYGGVISAGIAAVFMMLYRYFVVGGDFALSAVFGILPIIWFGVYWYRRNSSPKWWQWMLLGLASGVTTALIVIQFMSPDVTWVFLSNFWVVTTVFYPLSTLLIGVLVQREYRRLQLVRDLRSSEQRFQALFSQAFNMITLLNPMGNVLEANEASLVGCDEELKAAKGAPLWEMCSWRYSEEVQERLKQAIQRSREGELVRYQEHIIGGDGNLIAIDFSLKPFINEKGQVTHILAEGRDITRELEASERMMQFNLQRDLNQMIQGFVQDVSHHLRTPLTILKTSLYLVEHVVKNDKSNPKRALEELEARIPNMRQAINDLARLVEELLQLVEASPTTGDAIPLTNVTSTMMTELRQYADMIESAGLVLKLDLDDKPLMLRINPNDLRYILQNLIENAIRYTPKPGEITIRAKAESGTAVIEVQDTGIGIPPDALDKVFERFYRTDTARQHSHGGTGLGLAIVRQKVEAYNGTISVSSTLKQGSTFRVEFPAFRDALGHH